MKIKGLYKKTLRFRVVVVAVVLTQSFAAPAVVNAALDTSTNRYRSLNNIPFTGASSECSNGIPGVANNNDTSYGDRPNLVKTYGFFLGKGLKDYQAAGIVGNIIHENAASSRDLDPTIVEIHPNLPSNSTDPASLPAVTWPGGQVRQPGWGLVQWTPSGKVVGFQEKAGVSGDISTLDTHLEVLWWDITENETIFDIEAFRATTNLNDATDMFLRKYERPANPDASAATRINSAELVLDSLPKNPYMINLSADGVCLDDGAGADAMVALALNYAWENSGNGLNPKPAWRVAYDEARAAGQYVGSHATYADCGGFVSTVIRNSGVDPDFNHGATQGQLERYMKDVEKWQEVSPDEIKPGDIAIWDPDGSGGLGHTYMYVGEQPSRGTQVASASWDEHVPEAGTEMVGDPTYKWFRTKMTGNVGSFNKSIAFSSEQMTELQSFADSFAASGGNTAITIATLDGTIISTNGDRKMSAASVYKLFTAYSMSKRGMFTDDNKAGLRNMITLSTNEEAYSWGDKISWDNITTDAQSIGLSNTSIPGGEVNPNRVSTTNDVASFLAQLAKGELMNSQDTSLLLDLMSQSKTNEGGQGIYASGQTVANKSGWGTANAANDAAIINTPKGSYIVVIFSDRYPEGFGFIKEAAINIKRIVDK